MSGSSITAVQATNDDASASKLSCVKRGYIEDKFVQFFVRRPIKRSPIINRGYYARFAIMRKLLLQFLEAEWPENGEGLPQRKQILSLGAGFDTTFFQLKDEGMDKCRYVEIDFLEVTSKKAAIIASREELSRRLNDKASIHRESGEIHSEHYSLYPVDLRDLQALDAALEKANFNFWEPTLIIAECVLIYMEPETSRNIIKWAADRLQTAAFVVYEQIHPDDAFGQQMMRNLESRGCPLLGLTDTPTIAAKEKRFIDLGWQIAHGLDMDTIYNHLLDPVDRRRVERLEIFDEFEEWHIMQEHYCVTYAVKDQTGLLTKFGLERSETANANDERDLIN